MKYLSKNEAYQEMIKGNKVTHYYFDDEEYIYIENGKMYTEEGYRFEDGWEDRNKDYWQTGWSIYNKYA